MIYNKFPSHPQWHPSLVKCLLVQVRDLTRSFLTLQPYIFSCFRSRFTWVYATI